MATAFAGQEKRNLRWSSAVSDSPSFTEAVTQASEQILENLGGQRPDLAVVFISSHHTPSYFTAPEVLAEAGAGAESAALVRANE